MPDSVTLCPRPVTTSGIGGLNPVPSPNPGSSPLLLRFFAFKTPYHSGSLNPGKALGRQVGQKPWLNSTEERSQT
jgi:hypothetical protein